jgi:multicomponent Na+:H+ antiporter subunit A
VALVALIILFPWLGSAVLPCVRPVLGRHLGRWALLPPAASFLITLAFVPSVSHGRGFLFRLPWFPELGVNLSLWVDGLSVFFALLIAGIGLLIIDYMVFPLLPRPLRTARPLHQVPLHDRTIVNGWKAIEEEIAKPHRDD